MQSFILAFSNRDPLRHLWLFHPTFSTPETGKPLTEGDDKGWIDTTRIEPDGPFNIRKRAAEAAAERKHP